MVPYFRPRHLLLAVICCFSSSVFVWAAETGTPDFAELMPRETLLYVEVREPAAHVEQLAEAMGLMGERDSTGELATIKLDDGLVLSSDFRISPSLLAELKRIGGAAIGVLGPLEHGQPAPLVVIDPGQSTLLRGLIETGIQVVPRTDRIGGYATYHHPQGMWVVQTSSLFLASKRRSCLEEAISRLEGVGENLATLSTFVTCREESRGALIFAFVDGANLVEQLGPTMKGEAAVARAVLDLDHLRYATAMVTATTTGAKAEIRVNLKEDHNSLAYGLIRTVPFHRDVFAKIPAGVALVAAAGINPPLRLEANAPSQHLTALDIGREVFANLAEVALFVLPGVQTNHDNVPDFGLVVRSNDAKRSEALWSQLLALPTMLGSDDGPSVEVIELGGHQGRRYTLPAQDAPQIDMVRVDDATILFGTLPAVAASLATHRPDESILGDRELADAILKAPDHGSKAVFAHVGRLAGLAAQTERGHDRQHLEMVSRVLQHTKVAAVSDEAPHQLTIRVEASELPVLEEVIRLVAAMQRGPHPKTVVVHAE